MFLTSLDLLPISNPLLHTLKDQITAYGWPAIVNYLLDDVSDLTGLSDLKFWYSRLKEDVNYFLHPQHVFITEYAAPYLDRHGNIVGFPLAIPLPLFVSADDAKWIEDEVVVPLNAAISDAADANGWSYIGGIKRSFWGHQYSDIWATSWYQTLWGSLGDQGDFYGALHPNQAGHKQIAAQLYTQTLFPWDAQPCMKQLLKSHADLNVYDPLGRHLGVNRVTGEFDELIPGGTLQYYLDANQDGIYEPSEEQHPTDYRNIPTNWVQIASLPQLLAGDYRTELVGTSNGPFDLIVEGSQNGVNIPGEQFSGTISTGDRLISTTAVTAVDENLTLIFSPLVAMPTVEVTIEGTQRIVVTPGANATIETSVSEIGGRIGLQDVTIQATDLVGQWGVIPASSVSFSSNGFDLAAGETQSIIVSCDIPADFWGVADGRLTVTSADGSSETVDLRIKYESLRVAPLEVTPRLPREGGIAEVSASFLDLDEYVGHTVAVDWGDGSSPVLVAVDEQGGFGMVVSDHIYTDIGGYTITVTVTDDGGVSVIASTHVDVMNIQPIAVPDSYEVVENKLFQVTATDGVFINDHDANEDELRTVLVDGPKYGTLALAEDGSFSYMPSTNFNREDSFTYRATDGLLTSDPVVVAITVQTIYPWHNGIEPLNVNDDGYFKGNEFVNFITPLDALVVINELNRAGSHKLLVDRPRPLAPPFFDANRDGFVTPLDALWVINYLNRRRDGGEGERGELAVDPILIAPSVDPHSSRFGKAREATSTSTIASATVAALLSPYTGMSPTKIAPDGAIWDDDDSEWVMEDLEDTLQQLVCDQLDL
jgi:hypothetical protein